MHCQLRHPAVNLADISKIIVKPPKGFWFLSSKIETDSKRERENGGGTQSLTIKCRRIEKGVINIFFKLCTKCLSEHKVTCLPDW